MKFTPDEGKVTVRGQVLSDSIVLVIADTGIGIAPDSLRRLGKPFEQVESQLTKTYQGSGLGLAIARSLTNLHGGTMRLRSKLGAGTVVRIRLPRQPERHEAGRGGCSGLLQRRRDFAGDLHQRCDQRRHRIALRDHEADAVVDDGIDDRNASGRCPPAPASPRASPASRSPSARS